jgi:hypothetical protein
MIEPSPPSQSRPGVLTYLFRGLFVLTDGRFAVWNNGCAAVWMNGRCSMFYAFYASGIIFRSQGPFQKVCRVTHTHAVPAHDAVRMSGCDAMRRTQCPGMWWDCTGLHDFQAFMTAFCCLHTAPWSVMKNLHQNALLQKDADVYDLNLVEGFVSNLNKCLYVIKKSRITVSTV